jgi:hypothetical protein
VWSISCYTFYALFYNIFVCRAPRRKAKTPEQREREKTQDRKRKADYSEDKNQAVAASRRVVNMSEEQLQALHSSRQVANMSEEQLQALNSSRQVANMSEERVQAHHSSRQVANMSEERVQALNSSRQVANMSEERVQAHHSSRQVANMSEERVQARHSSRQVANMSEERLQALHSSRQVANMSEERVQAHHSSRQVANMSEERVQARHSSRQVANMSEERLQALHSSRQVANMSEERIQTVRSSQLHENSSPARIGNHRFQNRHSSNSKSKAGPTAVRGYYGNIEDAQFISDDEDDSSETDEIESSRTNEDKEKYDTKKYIKFLNKGSDLRLCGVCHEEHSAIFIPKKIYEPSDPIFNPLRSTPSADPLLAFDIEFMESADIPLRVCKRCLQILKKEGVPPRSVKNFHLLDKEEFMKFFRNLDRLQARLITKVIPITTINIQKVYGESNSIQHAKTTNNTISLRAATSKVIEDMLPRPLDNIGMIYIRSRSSNLRNAQIQNKYHQIAVNVVPVLRALGVLTGTADGMISPLNGFYKSTDTSPEYVTDYIAQMEQCGGQPATVDMTEDDNDDELGNTTQNMKRKIREMFGGKKFAVKRPMDYNSRFNAHAYIPGCGAIHAISAACHWDFGGMNMLSTFQCLQQLADYDSTVTVPKETVMVDHIMAALNMNNPDVNMEPRSKYPPILYSHYIISNHQHTFGQLLQNCLSPSGLSPEDCLGDVNIVFDNVYEIKQIILQFCGEDKFKTYVRKNQVEPLWYEFDASAETTTNMILPICESDIDISDVFACWACTAPLLEDTTHTHNLMMENVRQSMRRNVVEFISKNASSMPTVDDSLQSKTTAYSEDIDFSDEVGDNQENVYPSDIQDSIGNMERFLDVEAWDMNSLRQAIIDMDIGEGDKSVSGNIVIDSGEDGIPVFDYEQRPFSDRETGKHPCDTVGYTFPHLFPDGKGGLHDEREIEVSLTDWVSHLMHYCEVIPKEDGTFVRVRRFSTSLDFCFWLENKLQLRRASGIAFIAGDRARQRGIHNPLSSSAMKTADLLVAIEAAKAMTVEEFASIKTDQSKMSLTHRILRQLEPYGENYLNSYMQTKHVRRCATAALMDPDAIEGADPAVFFTVNQDDQNHIDIYKMIHAHKYKDTFAQDIIVSEDDETFAKQQALDVADNPFMCVKYFHHRKAGILKFIINGLRKPFGGELVDAVLKSEFQRYGGLHFHGVLWIARKLNMKPEEILLCEEGLRHVEKLVDDMYDGTIPLGLDCSDLTATDEPCILDPTEEVPIAICQAALKKVRSRARAIIPTSTNSHERMLDYRYCVLAKQAHKCCFTCYKKGCECRFHFPRELSDTVSLELELEVQNTTTSAIRGLNITIEQNHCWINHHGKEFLTTNLRCNHDVRLCINPWGDAFYCLNYTTKDGNPDVNILNRRVHKALCRHSTDATLLDYLRSTVFQLDACRERGIVEVISTLLKFKHATFTRSCVKLNTQKPEKRRTSIRQTQVPKEDDDIINDDGINDDDDIEVDYNTRGQHGAISTLFEDEDENDGEAEIVYELCESVATTVIYEAYVQRPHTGQCPHLKIQWDEVCLVDFLAWYKPASASTGKNHRIELLDGKFWMARSRRAVVLFVPYIPLNVGSEESAYSVLVSFIPFRIEDDLVPPQFDGSAVDALNAIRNSPDALPDHIRHRLDTRLRRERTREDISTTASANATFNDIHGGFGDSYDLDAMPDGADIDCMNTTDDELNVDTNPSDEIISADCICDEVFVFNTSNKALFARLSNSLTLLKENFQKHNLEQRQGLNVSSVPRSINNISTIAEDMESLKKSFKQTSAYCLAKSVFEECQRDPEATPLSMRISGPAGTGKSTVLRAIIRLAREMFIPNEHTGSNGTVIVGAWSGIASYNCGGRTLASMFCSKSNSENIIQKLRGVKVIIIDEDSTCPLHCLGTIDQQCRIANGINKPYGGAHTIMAGDMRQLKSVKSVAMYESPPLNNTDPRKADFYEKLRIGRTRYMEITNYIELTKNFRQEKSMILGECLGRCRTNEESPNDITLLNTRYMPNMQQSLLEVQTKEHAICLASTRKVVNEINETFSKTLISQRRRTITSHALHRAVRAQRIRATGSSNFDNNEDTAFNATNDTGGSDRLDSGLTDTQRMSCLLHDKDGEIGKLRSLLTLSIGSRVMLIHNVSTMLGLVNGTTGTIVGFVYSTIEGANVIYEKADLSIAARIEPQLPVVLMRVDNEFWKAPDHMFEIKPPLDIPGNWERVIAVPPVESSSTFKLKFRTGTKSVKRIQLPLIPAFALTIHKAQGLSKAIVCFIASSKLFARALAYVALSRCQTLEGLYIVGAKITTKHFKQTFGNEDGVIKSETARLRKFQLNTLRKGFEAACLLLGVPYDASNIRFTDDEREFDTSY